MGEEEEEVSEAPLYYKWKNEFLLYLGFTGFFIGIFIGIPLMLISMLLNSLDEFMSGSVIAVICFSIFIFCLPLDDIKEKKRTYKLIFTLITNSKMYSYQELRNETGMTTVMIKDIIYHLVSKEKIKGSYTSDRFIPSDPHRSKDYPVESKTTNTDFTAFYCLLCEQKHHAGVPRLKCQSCGRYLCLDSFYEMSKTTRIHCPLCDGKLDFLS